jgi:quinol monooxygenase YgiN
MQGKVTVIAFHGAKRGKALREALLAVRAPTLAEKSCINYDLRESPHALGILVSFENWESKADLDTRRGGSLTNRDTHDPSQSPSRGRGPVG